MLINLLDEKLKKYEPKIYEVDNKKEIEAICEGYEIKYDNIIRIVSDQNIIIITLNLVLNLASAIVQVKTNNNSDYIKDLKKLANPLVVPPLE